jgi:hypothetical protein
MLMVGTLVSTACCTADDKPARASRCHSETPASYCPMRGADGVACPMHRDVERSSCSMRGPCGDPVAALATVLCSAGEPPSTAAFPPAERGQTAGCAITQHITKPPTLPDTPPPRA